MSQILAHGNDELRRIKIYLGLGEAFIDIFIWITVCGFAAAVVATVIARLLFRVRLRWCLLTAPVAGTVLAFDSRKEWEVEVLVGTDLWILE